MSRRIIEDMNTIPEVCPIHKCAMIWYGDWYCPECQKEEEIWCGEQESKWFSECALCLKCAFAEGPYSNDLCGYYKMPLYMVKRKHKCKHFKEYIERPGCLPYDNLKEEE